MASTQNERLDDELDTYDDDEDLLIRDIYDIIRRWNVVHLLNELGWLQIPLDLELINEEDGLGMGERNLTIAHRILIAFCGWPEKMRPIADAENIDVASARFIDGKYIQGSCEFNQRFKGRSVLFKALTAHLNTEELKVSHFPEALRTYLEALDTTCPLLPDQLNDITTYTSYHRQLLNFHKNYADFGKYSIGQPIRVALWWIYLRCIQNSKYEPIRNLYPTFVDAHSHMSLSGDNIIHEWEQDNNMLVATGPIFTCLVGNVMSTDLLKIPGSIEYLRRKRQEFFAVHGRYPSISMFGRWLDQYLYMSASVNPPKLTDEMVIDVLTYPALIPRLLTRMKPHTKIMVSCPNPHDLSLLIIQAISPARMRKRAYYFRMSTSQWSEIFVTTLPSSFIAKCARDPSKFITIVGTSRANAPLHTPPNDAQPSSSLDDPCPGRGLAKTPVLFISESLGSVRFQSVRNSHLCCWLAVCNALASYDLDCTVLVDALEHDMGRHPFDRELEGLTMKEISTKLPAYIPKVQLQKRTLVEPKALIAQCHSTPEHLPRIVMIGWFHAFCIINAQIHCSSEKSPIPLTMENLRRCSDFIDADFDDLKMVVHREVVYTRRSKKHAGPKLSRSQRKKLRTSER